MNTIDSHHTITTLEQLEARFDKVAESPLLKEVDYLHPHYCKMIEASPFVMLATSGPQGLDASPRGDPAGFVVVHDAKTLLLPERRGNNRIDSLRNILTDPRVALLFLIPGVGETLRVNGHASITVDPDLLDRFVVNGLPPKCVIRIQVDTVFFQCARAIKRANLWHMPAEKPDVPTPGAILSALSNQFDGVAYDRGLEEKQKQTLY